MCLDARDPRALATFYSNVLGWPISQLDESGGAIGVPNTVSFISVQRNDDYVAPTWPAAPGAQQMMLHLDVAVDELEDAVEDCLSYGATLAASQPQERVRVLLDPEGHPFCLYHDSDLDDA